MCRKPLALTLATVEVRCSVERTTPVGAAALKCSSDHLSMAYLDFEPFPLSVIFDKQGVIIMLHSTYLETRFHALTLRQSAFG